MLLVNLTFDTWFGETAAPFQHHLIAAFRAIENRRYLIRSSNSGYSAIVDPLGQTIASIRPFTAGTTSAKVRLIDEQTPYTAYRGRNALVVAAHCDNWHDDRSEVASRCDDSWRDSQVFWASR